MEFKADTVNERLAKVEQLVERAEQLARIARRGEPAHKLFAVELAEHLNTLGDGVVKVHDTEIRVLRGPLGGISTRVPITWYDEDDRKHNIMITIYADGNIDEFFERRGITT